MNGAYRYRYAPFLCVYSQPFTSLALPLGELSPQVTERENVLSVLTSLGHLSQRERQGYGGKLLDKFRFV